MRFRLTVSIAAIFACIVGLPASATTFTDGEFFTYDQNIWGADPSDGPPASFVVADFFSIFTAGFEVGDSAPGGFVMDFSAADALLSYLPASGAAGALDANLLDPTSTSSGSFGGNVIALRLNIDFSDAGIYTDPLHLGHGAAHPPGIAFGDLIYTGFTGSLAGIDGLTVRQVSAIANVLLGGGAEPFSIADFSTLTNLTNSAFEGGAADKGPFFNVDDHFLLPDISTPMPEPASWILMLSSLALLGVVRRSRRSNIRPDEWTRGQRPSHAFRAAWGGCAYMIWAPGKSTNLRIFRKQVLVSMVLLGAVGLLAPSFAAAQTPYTVKPVAQKKVKELPAGPLYWRVENFPTLADAKAAVGTDGWNPAAVRYETTTALIAEVAGKVWVLTLGPIGASTPGGNKVAEIGPVPTITASEYLLRVNEGSGPPGSETPVHSHPGSEAFYVIAGELGQRTQHGVMRVEAGHTMNGREPGMPMQVFNSGSTNLTALIMFVVDATKPFSEPAKLE